MRHLINLSLSFFFLLSVSPFAKAGRAFDLYEIAVIPASETLLPPSDSICEGEFYFSRQSQIDSFLIEHPNCNAVMGSITLNNATNEITSTAAFSNLHYVSDDVNLLFEGQYFDLSGFIALDSIGDSLRMQNLDWWYINEIPDFTFSGLQNIQSMDHFVFNGYLYDGYNMFPSLTTCRTISFKGYTIIPPSQSAVIPTYINFNDSFNNLQTVDSISFKNISGYPSINGPLIYTFSVTNSFNTLHSAKRIFFGFIDGSISNSFSSLQNTEELTIGPDYYYYAKINVLGNSFENLSTIQNLTVITESSSFPNFDAITTINNLQYDPGGGTYSINTPIFSSLETILGEAFIFLSGPLIEMAHLSVVNGNLYIYLYPTSYYAGPMSISLPALQFVNGQVNISDDGSLDGTILQSFTAPQLYQVEGSLFLYGSNLTTCISPAFCVSANYSPNHIDVTGGPGCSSVEEIQAQCDALCADIDLNGICDSVQTEYAGDLTFSAFHEIQEFAIAFPQVSILNGNLFLTDYNDTLLTPIDTYPLQNLITINGDLFIRPDFGVSGFDNLQYVGGIFIYDGMEHSFESYNNGLHLPCFPNLIECRRISLTVSYWSPNTLDLSGSFSLVSRCDTLEIIGYAGNQLFNNLSTCSVLNISSDYLNIPEIGQDPMSLLGPLQVPVYSSYNTISNSFNNLDSLEILLVSQSEFTNSFINLSSCTTFFTNGVRLLESSPHFSFCNNIASYGASEIMHCFDALTETQLIGIYSSETNIDFPNLRELDFADLFLTDNVTLNLPLLDSIHTSAWIIAANTFALNATIDLGSLDFVQSMTFLNVECNELQLPSNWSCVNLGIENVQGLISLNDLTVIEPGNINITQCNDFSICSSPGLCEHISQFPESSFFANNAAGCSSIEEIQAQCDAPCADIDLNGICDSVQTVYEGNLEFTSTTEVESFALAFPQVHKIIGDLTLSGYIGDAMLETAALINLDTIQGLLSYMNYDQAGIAFSGFTNLRHVDTFSGAFPFYNEGVTYNENDSTPIYSYCTNCFPSLLSAKKMNILQANQFSFNSLVTCDTLAIDCVELNGAFPSLIYCNVLSINTSYNTTYPNTGSTFDANPIILFQNPLLTNEYTCESAIFNSFNQLDSIDCLFATNLEITQSLVNVQHCRTLYFNNVLSFESLPNLNSCNNLFSFGNSLIDQIYENLTTLNYVGIYSQETSINLQQLHRINWGEFFLVDNSNLHLNQLDSILTAAYFYSAYISDGDINANNISIHLPELNYAATMNLSNLNITQFEISSEYACGYLYAGYSNGLESMGNINPIIGIAVFECPDYSQCNSTGICNFCSEHPADCYFQNNAPGCNSTDEVLIQCAGSSASGIVYYDLNCNQQFDDIDAPVSYPLLLAGDTLPIGTSGNDGYFLVPLQQNSTLAIYPQHSEEWSTGGPTLLTIGDSIVTLSNVQIGLCPVSVVHDVSIHMNASMQPRPGFTVRYNLIAQNEWPGSDSVSVTFDTSLMPGATITAYAAGGTQQGATVSFATDLLYGQSQLLWVDVLVPVGTPLGTAYTAMATIALANGSVEDNHPENNTYTLQQTVIGSYDPNDKLVTPETIDLLDLDSTATEWLEYTIRFQNTGTAEAIFVRVLDTLSQAFDLTSFELIATSHPCEVTFHDNHSIEWFFDNILLPDSFTNEPASHGYIQFRIQTLPLSEPFSLENEAAIYFDFNEPVITPPAITHIVICDEAGNACDDGNACTVNDAIQADCSCAGNFTDADGDGVCDAAENCIWSPILISADSDTTLSCNTELPMFTAIFEMPDSTEFSVSFSDSLLQAEGCNFAVLQTAIAINACGDTTSVSRTVSFTDAEQPTFIECSPLATVICNTYGSNLQIPTAIDNCSSDVVITYTEECLDCTADSLVYPLTTPIRPADNICNYPYDWSLALFSAPTPHRWYQLDASVPATMTDYLNGNVRFHGRWVNALDSTAGFDFQFSLSEGQNWDTWSNGEFANGYTADCGGLDEQHPYWMYYILQASTEVQLTGWGGYAGSMLQLTHAPANQYFGYQIGLGANGYNSQYGAGGWAIYSGVFLHNGEPIAGGNSGGVSDIRFALPSCSAHTSLVTWSATDCAGNTATCTQTISFVPELDQPACFIDNPCNDGDPCTTGDSFQADCSCVGTFTDSDSDGICDALEPCENGIPGTNCDDGNPCTLNDILQADCTCAGTYFDTDSDGLCDAQDDCDNTLAGTSCDDADACTVNDIVQADCSCSGTYSDVDTDGICDAQEVTGCTDIEACNYNSDSTDDDGSCYYIELYTISGNTSVIAGTQEEYTYPGQASGSFTWVVNPGTITAGQGTGVVSVVWSDALSGTIQVTETSETNCMGESVILEVNISPNATTEVDSPSLTLYPNPAHHLLNLTGNVGASDQMAIFNSIGQCIEKCVFKPSMDVSNLASGIYHLQVEHNGAVLRKTFTILHQP